MLYMVNHGKYEKKNQNKDNKNKKTLLSMLQDLHILITIFLVKD